MKPTLYMMLGYPGAGKTTTAASIARVTGALHISSDDIRREILPDSQFTQAEHDKLYAELDKRVIELLSNGRSVVYDANLNRHAHRQEKYHLAQSLDVQTVLVWVKTPQDLAKHRRVTAEPQHDLTPQHETPEQMFDRIAKLFEPPHANEPYIELDGTKISDEYTRSALGI
jgi:predicted kinase